MSEPADLSALRSEGANPRTKNFDLLSTADMVRAMHAEDRRAVEATGEVLDAVARAVDLAAERLRGGGRLLSLGAGTSGRLAVLDASEIPPTFGVSPSTIVGRVAGGDRALREAIEGAEDDAELGRRDVREENLGAEDVLVALAASGRTPYVLGALTEARARGAATIAIVCNRPTPAHVLADVVVDPLVGEEALAGSTRLKAGTAQKLILNMISTCVMTKLGRVYGNLMVGVAATNEKLKARAARLVHEIAAVPEARARDLLAAAAWDVRVACLMTRFSIDPAAARARLDAAHGSLRIALSVGQ